MKPLPLPVREPLRAGFRALAGLRRAPAFHPKGCLYEAELVVDGEGPLPAGTTPALVRLSKGIGTPDGAPDLLGVATRVERPGAPLDFLCTSAMATSGWRRFVLAPATSWGRVSLSSLMVWQRGDEQLTACLELSDPRIGSSDCAAVSGALPVRIAVLVVDSAGSAVQTGQLALLESSDRPMESVAFDPELNGPPGWELGPRWLARIRETAYIGSRRGRQAHDGSLD